MFHFNPRSSAGYGDGVNGPCLLDLTSIYLWQMLMWPICEGYAIFRKPFPLVTMARRIYKSRSVLSYQHFKVSKCFSLAGADN
jgi:hypothetical protein